MEVILFPSLKTVWNQTQSQKGLESDPVSKESGIRPSLKRVWDQTQSQKSLDQSQKGLGVALIPRPFILLRIVMVPKVEQW